MTTEQAWEIYDSQKGKNGRPKKEFVEAEAMLIKSGELNLAISTKDGGEDDKYTPIHMVPIDCPDSVDHATRVKIYREGINFLADKRNFSSRHYLTMRYALTNDDLDKWESESPEIKRLASVAHCIAEHKLLNGLPNKYSVINPIGAMLTLKAVYGYNDRGDSGALKAEGVIAINAETDESDFVDIGEYYTEDEGVQSEDQSEYDIQ